MTLTLRRIVHRAAPALLLAALAFSAHAQTYPNADIHFVTGFPPGSGADVITRYFAEKLRPVAVAEEIERLLDRLIGLAARRCAQLTDELVQRRMSELRVLGEQRQQERQRLGEIACLRWGRGSGRRRGGGTRYILCSLGCPYTG